MSDSGYSGDGDSAMDFRYANDYGKLTERFEVLRSKIAEREHWSSECVLPTNGATGALGAIFLSIALQKYQSGECPAAVVAVPEYFDALKQLKLSGYQLVEIKGENFAYPVKEIGEAIRRVKPALCYISRPRNPTGELIEGAALDEILSTGDKTCIVLDRSLLHPDDVYANSELREKWGDKNIVIVDSFSKKEGLILERAGYLLTMNKETLERIHPYAHAPSYDTMQRAIKAAEGGIHREKQIEKFRASDALFKAWKHERAEYHPSLSNFALITLLTLTGEECRKALEYEGFLVRSGEQLYMDDTAIRVDMSQPENIPGFLEALQQILVSV